MRKIKRILLAIAVALVLVALSAVAIFASTEAASSEPTVALKSASLNLGNTVYIKLTASGTDLPQDSKIQILVWDSPQTDYTIQNENTPDVVNSSGVDEKGRTVFYYTNVSAKEMATDFYFVACVNCNGEYIYSPVQKYSVLQYAYTYGSDPELADLLDAILEYGAMAQLYLGYNTDRLANDTFYQIKVENGLLSDAQKRGLFLSTDSVTMIANAPEDGYEFAGWENSANEIVSTSPTYTLHSVSKADTYTATYEKLERKEPAAETSFVFTPLADGTYSVKAADDVTFPSELVIPAYYNGAKVTAIADRGFANHTEIESVRFEYTNVLETIGTGAFADCTNLLSVLVPSKVTTIGEAAFDGCCKLVEVYNLSELSITAGSAGNGSIAEFALDVYNRRSSPSKLSRLENGCIIRADDSTNMTTIVAFTSLSDSLTLPDTINSTSYTVNSYAFAGNTTLQKLDLGAGLTSIGSYAFKNATALRSVVATDTDALAEIGSNAFEGCINLTAIYLSENVTTVGANVFSGCSLTVYTPLDSKPSGWDNNWNSSNCEVKWSYTEPEADTPIAPAK